MPIIYRGACHMVSPTLAWVTWWRKNHIHSALNKFFTEMTLLYRTRTKSQMCPHVTCVLKFVPYSGCLVIDSVADPGPVQTGVSYTVSTLWVTMVTISLLPHVYRTLPLSPATVYITWHLTQLSRDRLTRLTHVGSPGGLFFHHRSSCHWVPHMPPEKLTIM